MPSLRAAEKDMRGGHVTARGCARALEAMAASGDMKAIGAGVAVNGAYIFPCALIAIGAKRDRRAWVDAAE